MGCVEKILGIIKFFGRRKVDFFAFWWRNGIFTSVFIGLFKIIEIIFTKKNEIVTNLFNGKSFSI